MLSYITDLTHIMCNKVSGKSIYGSPDVDRLVEIRTVRHCLILLIVKRVMQLLLFIYVSVCSLHCVSKNWPLFNIL